MLKLQADGLGALFQALSQPGPRRRQHPLYEALPVSVTERKEKFTLVFETSWKTACHISVTEGRPTVALEFEGAETLATTTSLEEEMKGLHATHITHLQDTLTMLI